MAAGKPTTAVMTMSRIASRRNASGMKLALAAVLRSTFPTGNSEELFAIVVSGAVCRRAGMANAHPGLMDLSHHPRTLAGIARGRAR